MLDERARKTPRASRLMIDLLHAIGECADVVQHWDVGKRAEGVVVRARSRDSQSSQHAAIAVADLIAGRLVPAAYHGEVLNVVARPDGGARSGWHAVVEVVVT